MSLPTVRSSIGNMFVTILGLFMCFMVIPSSSFADPFWSIGISGGNEGINGLTLSISDYGGIPVYSDQSGPPRGHAYGYYDDHPKQQWGRANHHDEGMPHPMNRPHGYQQNGYRQDQHNQNYNRPDAHQPNGDRQTHYGQDMGRQNKNMQNMARPNRDRQHQWEKGMMNNSTSRLNQHAQSFSQPNGYQQNGSLQNQPKQNIDKQKREKQHQWEMSMMN
jgi:hypothetical protein